MKGTCVWLTGLSGAGKTTVAGVLVKLLLERGHAATVFDGDVVRAHVSKDLGFSKEDRDRNVMRIAFMASEIVRDGGIAVCALVSPYRATRAECRRILGAAFVEVFVDAPLALCESRDVKGLYAKARRGEICGFTGIDDPYEDPIDPEVHLQTANCSAESAAHQLLNYVLHSL